MPENKPRRARAITLWPEWAWAITLNHPLLLLVARGRIGHA